MHREMSGLALNEHKRLKQRREIKVSLVPMKSSDLKYAINLATHLTVTVRRMEELVRLAQALIGLQKKF